MTIWKLVLIPIFIITASCNTIKWRADMATISSSEYKCDNRQLLNTERWWTEPMSLSDNPNSVVLCGGNVPNSTGPGVGDDSCISVDLYTCVSSKVPATMGTARQSLQPICLTAGQCYLFGGNTSTASEATRSVDYFDLKRRTLQKAKWQLPEPRLCYAAISLSDFDFVVTGGYGVKDPATGKGPVYNTAVRFNSVTGQATTIAMTHQLRLTPFAQGTARRGELRKIGVRVATPLCLKWSEYLLG